MSGSEASSSEPSGSASSGATAEPHLRGASDRSGVEQGGACQTSQSNVDLGDSRLRIKIEMETVDKRDEVPMPEMTAKAWDDYLHRCGPEAYISARYSSSVRDTTLSPCPDRLDRAAVDRSREARAKTHAIVALDANRATTSREQGQS